MAREIPASVRLLIAKSDVSSLNVTAFCRDHDVSRSQFYELRRRYEREGLGGLEPRSRAPKRVANRTPIEVEDLIVKWRKDLDGKGLDAGPESIQWQLIRELDGGEVPSKSTIWRVLKDRGLVVADKSKSPRKVWTRFESDRANDVFQIDGTDYRLADGVVVKIINVIDDGSRYCCASRAWPTESFDAAWNTLLVAFSEAGMCANVLSDNGKAFTKLAEPLAALGIAKKASSPFHPQTCGKVERFHQTQAKWLNARPQAATIQELQDLLDEFQQVYNHQRPHRAKQNTTPAQARNAMAKNGPANQPLNLNTPTTVHHATVRPNGVIHVKRFNISLGAKHAGASAQAIITANNADVFINGKHIRNLVINPTRRSQPIHPRPGRPTT